MPNPVTARYRARDGDEHLVAVERAVEHRWRIVDIAGTAAVLVDTLAGPEDRRAQAEALALDYAAQQDAFHRGRARAIRSEGRRRGRPDRHPRSRQPHGRLLSGGQERRAHPATATPDTP